MKKAIEIGYIEKGTGKHQSNVVYSLDGLCPTIPASTGVKEPPKMFLEEVSNEQLFNAEREREWNKFVLENSLLESVTDLWDFLTRTLTKLKKSIVIRNCINKPEIPLLLMSSWKSLRKCYDNTRKNRRDVPTA